MAITEAYATVADYKAKNGWNAGADEETLERQLNAVSRLYDRLTGQFFGIDAAAVVRVFKAKYSRDLELWVDGRVPGIGSTSGLEIKVDTDNDGSFADETAWASTDYELLPRNAADGPEQRPYDRICVPDWGTQYFIPGNLVQVTAIWGWPSVPEPVRENVIELTAIWRGESPRSSGRMSELDEVVSTSPMAMSLVKRITESYMQKVSF